MGQRITLTDDFDESIDAVGSLTFFKDGEEYAIDLGEENMKKYTEILEVHAQLLDILAEHGRRVERQKLLAPKKRTKEEYDVIRAWARQNGFPQVKDSGRIADHIIAKFDKTQREAQKVEETKNETPEGGDA